MNTLNPGSECRANGIADDLALALARLWCRDHPFAPRLVAGRSGALVNISFTVDGDIDVYDVTSRLSELVVELRTLSPHGM